MIRPCVEIRSKNRIISIIQTRPHDLVRESTYDRNIYPDVKSVQLEVNFFRLVKQIPEWNIHQYSVCMFVICDFHLRSFECELNIKKKQNDIFEK